MTKVLVIGAGFYGLSISEQIAQRTKSKVSLFEQAIGLGHGASWANQARVHGGYHYPRDVRTGSRSRKGLSRFKKDFGASIFQDFEMLYAIARENSKTSPSQFEAFCRRISAPVAPASPEFLKLFDSSRVEAVFLVEEPAFNSEVLLQIAKEKAIASGVQIRFGTQVLQVEEDGEALRVSSQNKGVETFDFVVDCTYSNLGTLFGPASRLAKELKTERAELALLEVPTALRRIGITVMDGPFFSLMPFPTRGLHSFSHVSYTPRSTRFQSDEAHGFTDTSAIQRMRADAAKFLPIVTEANHVSSIFVDKAILVSSELDDARPILLAQSGLRNNYISVLGSKIDTVYDALDSIFLNTRLGSLL